MIRFMAVAAALLAAVALPAGAANDLVLAGASDSPLSNFSYVGVLVPLGDGRLGQGWILRQWVDRVAYRYNGFVPDIHAVGYDYAPALGYQWALDGGANHAALYAGVDAIHVSLNPYDPGNVDRGTHVRLTLQGEFTSNIGDWAQNQFLAEGEFGNGAYFVRDRFLWRIGEGYTLGPQVVAQGSREYRAHEEGICFGGVKVASRTRLLVHAGIYQQRGQATVGDFGLEITAVL